MCGVAGIARRRPVGVAAELLERMASAIRHRGPDGFGLHVDDRVGLTNARLSVIDLARGVQPMTNEDGSVFLVYNGEITSHCAASWRPAGTCSAPAATPRCWCTLTSNGASGCWSA